MNTNEDANKQPSKEKVKVKNPGTLSESLDMDIQGQPGMLTLGLGSP
jgi:hypothetical protein